MYRKGCKGLTIFVNFALFAQCFAVEKINFTEKFISIQITVFKDVVVSSAATVSVPSAAMDVPSVTVHIML
jgi:hypothetical protein